MNHRFFCPLERIKKSAVQLAILLFIFAFHHVSARAEQAETLTGHIEHHVIDNVGKEHVLTLIKVNSDQYFEITHPSPQIKNLPSGKRITCEVYRKKGLSQWGHIPITVSRILPNTGLSSTIPPNTNVKNPVSHSQTPLLKTHHGSDQPLPSQSTEKFVVAILVDFDNLAASDQLSHTTVANTLFHDKDSTRAIYALNSNQQFILRGDKDNNGETDIFQARIHVSIEQACHYSHWARLARENLKDYYDIDIQKWDYRVFIYPNEIPCKWGGIASLGCENGDCNTHIRTFHPGVIAHELGHNLGLSHSGIDYENDGKIEDPYGEHSLMGLPYQSTILAAPHRESLGWYRGIHNTMLTPQHSETVLLSALGQHSVTDNDDSMNNDSSTIKIPKKGTNEDYFVSFHQATDTLGTYHQYINRVLIQRRSQGKTGITTALISILEENEHFYDHDHGIHIHFENITRDKKAKIHLQLEDKLLPQNQQIRVSTESAYSGKLSVANDIKTSNLAFRIAKPPLHGDILLDSTGHFTYKPFTIDQHSDTFVFEAISEHDISPQGTIEMVFNQPPQTLDTYFSITMNDAKSFHEKIPVTDADGDVLTCNISDKTRHGNTTITNNGQHFHYVLNSSHSVDNTQRLDQFSFECSDGIDTSESIITIAMAKSENAYHPQPKESHFQSSQTNDSATNNLSLKVNASGKSGTANFIFLMMLILFGYISRQK